MKNQKGITLINLILIMVLLLVLAAISISLVVTADQKELKEPTSDYIEYGSSDIDTEDNTITNVINNEVNNEVIGNTVELTNTVKE